jgi:hypothetical protein
MQLARLFLPASRTGKGRERTQGDWFAFLVFTAPLILILFLLLFPS